jgi:predicted AlkP superfamily phosphohydrolase/phosphomutase
LEAGKLPTLKKIISKGCSGPLETINPTVSPTIWTTIATSRDYRDHGILGFKMALAIGMWLNFEKPDEKPHLVTSNLRKTKAIWTLLTEHDIPVGIINFLVSWPAESVHGFMVTDRAIKFPGEVENSVHPPEIENHVIEFIKSHKSSPHDFHNKFANDELAEDSSVVELALHLVPKYSPRVLVLGLRGTDAMEHQFWKYYKPNDPGWTNPENQPRPLTSTNNEVKGQLVEPYIPPPPEEIKQSKHLIPEYYIQVDSLLNRLFQGLNKDWTTIIVSDHGFTPPMHLNAPPGILICAGKPFNHYTNFKGYSVFDITPTILYLMDLPIAEDMVGHPMVKGMDPTLVTTLNPKSIPSYETDSVTEKVVGNRKSRSARYIER